MCAILQLVSAPLNPIPIAEFFHPLSFFPVPYSVFRYFVTRYFVTSLLCLVTPGYKKTNRGFHKILYGNS